MRSHGKSHVKHNVGIFVELFALPRGANEKADGSTMHPMGSLIMGSPAGGMGSTMHAMGNPTESANSRTPWEVRQFMP